MVEQLHQPVPVAGYRALSDAECAAMDEVKMAEAAFGAMLDRIAAMPAVAADPPTGHWLAMARTNAETAFMYALKAIARPTNGLGRRA